MPAQVGAAGSCGQHPQEWGAHPLQESLAFVRSLVKEVITSTNSNLTMSLLKLLDCFFKPFLPKEVRLSSGPQPAPSCPACLA